MTSSTRPNDSARFQHSRWASLLILTVLVILSFPGNSAVLEFRSTLIPGLDGDSPAGREVATPKSLEGELLESFGEAETEKGAALLGRAAVTARHASHVSSDARAITPRAALLRYAPKQDPPQH